MVINAALRRNIAVTLSRNDLPKYPVDPDQRKAAESGAGVTILTGGPGTGKSHTVVARVDFLLESGVPPTHIACVAATRGSAANLRRQMNSHPRVLANSDQIFVGPMVDLANLLVRLSQGWEALEVPPNYSIWTDAQTVEVMTRIFGAFDETTFKSDEIRKAMVWRRRNLWRGPDHEEIPEEDDRHRDISDLCQREKLWQRALDTDDLLFTATEVVEHIVKGELAAYDHWPRCHHLLVDGVEDFNQREIKLLALLAGVSGTLTLTADENQRIRGSYAGSKVHGVHPQHRGAEHHHLKLTQTGTAPLSGAAALLRRSDQMEGLSDDYDQIWDPVRGQNPRLVEVSGTNRDMAARVVADAIARHDQGVAWKDMAILCKTSTAMRPLWTLLAHRAIPYRVMGRYRSGQISDADCVRALLTCLINPWDLSAVSVAVGARHPNKERCLNQKISGELWARARALDRDLVTAAETHMRRFEEPESADLAWLVETHRYLQSILDRPGCDLTTLVAHAQEQVSRPAGPCALPDGETGVDFRNDRLWQAARDTPRDDGESLSVQLARFLDRTSTNFDPEGAASDRDGLTVSTWDAVKGQYWPVVFVVDVSDQTIPGRAYGGRRRQLERLWYTITTRATRELIFYCLKDIGKGNKPTPTRYLDPLQGLLETE